MKKLLLAFQLLACLAIAQTNYVMDFNGTTSNVNLGASVGNGVRSIEFWFKPTVNMSPGTTADGWSFIIRDDNTQFSEYGVYIRGTDWSGFGNIGQLCFYVRYSGILHEIKSNQNTWTAGIWYHIAGVIDPVSGMMLYVNGVLQTDTDPSATTAVAVDANSSYAGMWGTTANRHFNGRMDELRFWSRAISQNEIQAKMCQDLTPSNETGLQAYYKFNEGSGTQALDQTANAYTGAVSNTSWIIDSPCSPYVPSNYVNKYNGTSASNDIGNSAGSGLRSIEFWFKPAITINSGATGNGYVFIVRDDNTQSHEYGVYIKGTDWPGSVGKLAFFVRYNGTLHEIVSNSNSWTAGTWYHVAGVLDPSSGMHLYINGTLQTDADAAAVAATDVDNANPTKLGMWPVSGRYFSGYMDELRLWSRAISQTEIQNKMCQDLVPANETGLQAYYKFNEGNGSQVLDQTANAYHGSVSNTTWLVDSYCSTCTLAVNVTGVVNICSGASTMLTVNGTATSYTWSANAGGVNTNTVVVSPTVTTTYTLNTSNGSCNGVNIVTVNVMAAPTLSVSGNTNICSGTSTTLSGSGASSYTWNIGGVTVNSSTITATPSATTTFTLSGANGSCTGLTTVTITVTPTPTLSVAGVTAICSGNETVLTGSGATNYTWSPNAGSVTTSTVAVSPLSTTTYTLTGANGNCTVTNSVTVSVTPTPTINIAGNTNICSGAQATLTGSGASTYTWSANAGSAITASVSVTPGATDTYTLSGTDGTGQCTGELAITVTVMPSPTVTAASQTICAGATATLTASGANTFTWSPSPALSNGNGSLVVDSPTITTTYTITGTGSNSCQGSAIAVLTVDSCATGIAIVPQQGSVRLYPNPAQDQLTIEISGGDQHAFYEIRNTLGQLVLEGTLPQAVNKADLSQLENGIYMIAVTDHSGTVTRNIMIRR